MSRTVVPEILDELPPTDRGAAESRRDLQILNRFMGHARILAQSIRQNWHGPAPDCILDLGGGDGTLLFQVCKKLPEEWGGHSILYLLDRHPLCAPGIQEAFANRGWRLKSAAAEASDWLSEELPKLGRVLILTNLFLHHFEQETLRNYFEQIAFHACMFVACEPRRTKLAWFAAQSVGLLGCNWVTRHDAPVSVAAGFQGKELTALWPPISCWAVQEHARGLFTHVFMARRVLP